ncbi:MAG: hypothetical protein KAS32_11230, partial [Candidatus Peribacteraceae bacterium]|nr:hypothetical protein [Candidatus Peribacteraceae bacterium]
MNEFTYYKVVQWFYIYLKLMSIESPSNSQFLTEIAESGKTYVIAQEIAVRYMLGRMQESNLTLLLGDEITVKNYDSERGLMFTCDKCD